MNFALALIPAPYRWLAVALLAAALVAFGFVKGVQYEGSKADARQAAQEKAALQAHLAATQRGLNIMSDALVLEGVKNAQLSDVDRRLNAALGELRKRPDRPAPSTNPGDPPACVGATGAQLAAGDAEFLERYAADAARLHVAAKTCEARYEALRLRLNGK
jgi:hypothetical protein